MSQATVAPPVARSATARAGDSGRRRALPDRTREAADHYGSPSPSPLRVVRAAPLTRSSTGFAVCCATLLGLGLVALLLLNTTLSQRAFTLHALQRTSGQLADTQDALSQSLARTGSPARLAARASALGMVPAQSTAFLRLSDGAVLGVAKPAQPQLGFSVVTAPTMGKPATAGFARVGSAQRESASAHLPTTTSTRVSTKGATTTTTSTTTVTDASHNTVRTTTRSVAVTGSDSGGTQSTQQRVTTTVRTVKTTDKGTTTTTQVTRPDGSSSRTTVTVSAAAAAAPALAPAPASALALAPTPTPALR